MFKLIFQLHDSKRIEAILVNRVQVMNGENESLIYLSTDKFNTLSWEHVCDWATIDGQNIYCAAIRKTLNP